MAESERGNVASQVPSPNLPRNADSVTTGAPLGNIPVLSPGMTFSEVGVTGLRQFSGWIREEFLTQLVGRQAAQKFREMRDNSPTIGAILNTIEATMRKVEWRAIPANDGPEAQEKADFIQEVMDDMSETWEDHVAQALSMITFGFAPHEIVYKRRNGRDPGEDPDNPGEELPQSKYNDGLIGWRRLPLRGQDTVIKWFFDKNGQTRGLTQQPWTGGLIDIPIEKQLLFRAKPFKGNPEGISILRNSYVPYYYVKRLQEHEAILAERFGGVPLIKIPSITIEAAQRGDAGAKAMLDEYKRIATNIRINEQMGIVMPSDVYQGANGPSSVPQYTFELVAPQNNRSGFEYDKVITRYNVSMMTSCLADFLQLGHEARGTQSLAVSKVDMFFQAIEGWLNAMAAVYNRYGIPRLWALNGFDDDLMPRLEPDLAQRVDLDVLSNYILRLSQAGMPLFPNEELEQYILDAGGLPDVTDDRALRAAGVSDEQLEVEDQKEQEALAQAQARTDQMENPPEPGAGASPFGGGKPKTNGKAGEPKPSPLQKMIAASIARRQIRHAGPRFGIRTKQ